MWLSRLRKNLSCVYLLFLDCFIETHAHKQSMLIYRSPWFKDCLKQVQRLLGTLDTQVLCTKGIAGLNYIAHNFEVNFGFLNNLWINSATFEKSQKWDTKIVGTICPNWHACSFRGSLYKGMQDHTVESNVCIMDKIWKWHLTYSPSMLQRA